MKQYPSRLKYKKNHKLNSSNLILLDQKNFYPIYGKYFLKAIESGKLNFKHIEACRKSIRRNFKKMGLINIRLFTYFSQTKKALGSRMGKGKGAHNIWICPVRKGQIICEVSSISELKAYKALLSASSKLPLKTKIFKICY